MMGIAQRVPDALQGVIGFPVVVQRDAGEVFRHGAAFGRDAVERQQHGRGDVQPLGLAADPQAGLVEVLYRHRRDARVDGGGEALKPRGAILAHGGDGRRRQLHAEQVRHLQLIFERTDGVDGWVSLEVSPLLAHDTASTLAAAKALHDRAGRPNLFIKIPGTKEGLPAIEEAIFAGVPVNVTLLFSREQYVAAAEAYLRGVERRIAAGLNPDVGSVASVFVSRWDVAVASKVPAALANRLGVAIGGRTYKAYHDLLGSARWHRAANAGARAQRLLWASTGTKDPKASDILYVKALAAPFTVNTMPEGTLMAFGDHGEVGDVMATDEGDAEAVLASFAKAGIDIDALAARLQDEGAKSFVESWNDLMSRIETKSAMTRMAS